MLLSGKRTVVIEQNYAHTIALQYSCDDLLCCFATSYNVIYLYTSKVQIRPLCIESAKGLDNTDDEVYGNTHLYFIRMRCRRLYGKLSAYFTCGFFIQQQKICIYGFYIYTKRVECKAYKCNRKNDYVRSSYYNTPLLYTHHCGEMPGRTMNHLSLEEQIWVFFFCFVNISILYSSS